MTKKEKQAEEQELSQAVRILTATLRAMAKRKAHQYELDFLHRVRDMLDREIEVLEDVNELTADALGREVAAQVK